MSDDWSLKGKAKLWEDMCTNVYSEGEINALRLKLIEDLKKFCIKYSDDYNAWSGDMEKEATTLINLRFGVDE